MFEQRYGKQGSLGNTTPCPLECHATALPAELTPRNAPRRNPPPSAAPRQCTRNWHSFVARYAPDTPAHPDAGNKPPPARWTVRMAESQTIDHRQTLITRVTPCRCYDRACEGAPGETEPTRAVRAGHAPGDRGRGQEAVRRAWLLRDYGQ